MRVHVFIATTKGPVQVQSIQRLKSFEDGTRVDSHAVVNREGVAGINNEYRHFVSTVIGPRFEFGQFLASIGCDIQKGDSWRLGLLLAHEIEANHALTLARDNLGSDDWVMLATGAVSTELEINSITHTDEKFDAAAEYLNDWLAAGARVAAIVPAANSSQFIDKLRVALVDNPDLGTLKLTYSDNVDDLLSELSLLPGLGAFASGAASSASQEIPPKKGRWWAAIAALVVAAVAGGSLFSPDMVHRGVDKSRDTIAMVVSGAEGIAEPMLDPSSSSSSSPAATATSSAHVKEGVDTDAGSSPGTLIVSDASDMSVPVLPDSDMSVPVLPEPSAVELTIVGGSGTHASPTSSNTSSEGEPLSVAVLSTDAKLRDVIRPIEAAFIEAGYDVFDDELVKEVLKLESDVTECQLVDRVAERKTIDAVVLVNVDVNRRQVDDLCRIDVDIKIRARDLQSCLLVAQKTSPYAEKAYGDCEERSMSDNVDQVVIEAVRSYDVGELMHDIRSRYAPTQSYSQPNTYRLIFKGLRAEERAGVEAALQALSGYVNHIPVQSGYRKATWSYESRLEASYLLGELYEIIAEEGISDAALSRDGNEISISLLPYESSTK